MQVNAMTLIRLIHYEWKKLFSFTFIRLIVALALVLNLAMAVFYIRPLDRYNVNGELEAVYALYETDPDAFRERYDAIVDAWYHEEAPADNYANGKTSDRTLFFTVECFANADSDHQKQMEAFLAKTEAFCQTLTPGSYNYRYQQAVIAKYEALGEAVEIKNEPVYGWEPYFGYSAEVIFVLIAVFACSTVIGLDDHTTGFVSLRVTSVRGAESTVAAKFIAVMTVSFMLAVIFALSSLLVIGLVYGFSDAGNAVQAVFSDVIHGKIGEESKKIDLMAFCPLALTIAEFLAVFFLHKAMAAVICGIVVFTAAVLCRRYWITGVVGGAFIFLQYRMSILDIFRMEQWKYLNIFSVFSAKDFLSRFRCVDLFGYPVDLIHVFYVLFFLVSVLSFLICMLSCKANSAVRRSFPYRKRSGGFCAWL